MKRCSKIIGSGNHYNSLTVRECRERLNGQTAIYRELLGNGASSYPARWLEPYFCCDLLLLLDHCLVRRGRQKGMAKCDALLRQFCDAIRADGLRSFIAANDRKPANQAPLTFQAFTDFVEALFEEFEKPGVIGTEKDIT